MLAVFGIMLWAKVPAIVAGMLGMPQRTFQIANFTSALVWVADDKGIVYSLANEQWRTDNARLHWLGQPLDSDVELYHEDDDGFRVGCSLTANEEWLVISASDHETSEVRLIAAADPLAQLHLAGSAAHSRL